MNIAYNEMVYEDFIFNRIGFDLIEPTDDQPAKVIKNAFGSMMPLTDAQYKALRKKLKKLEVGSDAYHHECEVAYNMRYHTLKERTQKKGNKYKTPLAVYADTETESGYGELLSFQFLPVHELLQIRPMVFLKNRANEAISKLETTVTTQGFDYLEGLYQEIKPFVKGRMRMFIHNSSFDLPRIMLDSVKDIVELEAITSGSALIRSVLSFRGIEIDVFDTFRMLPSSLAKLSKSLAPHCVKKELDHVRGFEVEKKEHVLYAIMDTIANWQVVESFAKHIGKDVFSLAMTAASEAFHQMRSLMVNSDGLPVNMSTKKETNVFFKAQAYNGGRVFLRDGMPLGVPVDHISLDITSSYPYQMMVQAVPLGVEPKTSVIKPTGNYLGRYFVRVHIKDYCSTFPVLPYREHDEHGIKTATYYPNGTFTTILADVEYEYFLKNPCGSTHTPLEYIYWKKEDCHYYMRPHVDKFYKIKVEGDRLNTIKKGSGDGVREVSKLMLNAPYGKFAQTYVQSAPLRFGMDKGVSYKIVEDESKEDSICESPKKKSYDHRAAYVAAFITAGARIKLMEVVDFYGAENISYCDTDSAKIVKSVVDAKGFPDCVQLDKYDADGKKIFEPAVLGMWKYEGVNKGLIIIAPKVYAYINEEGKVAIKSKGFPVKGIRRLFLGGSEVKAPLITTQEQENAWAVTCSQLIYQALLETKDVKAIYQPTPTTIRTFYNKGSIVEPKTKTLFNFDKTGAFDYDAEYNCYRIKRVESDDKGKSYHQWRKFYKENKTSI